MLAMKDPAVKPDFFTCWKDNVPELSLVADPRLHFESRICNVQMDNYFVQSQGSPIVPHGLTAYYVKFSDCFQFCS